MAKTKPVCIAVEGATTDGREIQRDWIDQMASGYVPATYTARINCEHIRGFSPDAPFNAYGSVDSLEARDVQLTLDGKAQTKRALFAVLDANDQMVATINADQKRFTSCEVSPNFAGTGKAYLVGLALTDNPASLGTDMLSFAAGAQTNPFAARKQDAANLFTAAAEAKIEIEAAPSTNDDSAFSRAMAAMASFFTQGSKPEEPAKPTPPANDNAAFAELKQGLQLLSASVTALGEKVTSDVAGIRDEFGQLKTELSSTEDAGRPKRHKATGGNSGKFTATDC